MSLKMNGVFFYFGNKSEAVTKYNQQHCGTIQSDEVIQPPRHCDVTFPLGIPPHQVKRQF